MLRLQGIKNIIFDLGGVIINLNEHLTVKAFQNIFLEKYPLMAEDIHAEQILENFETGEISINEFISFFKSYNANVTTKQITEAWNSMLLDIPEERIDLIKNLAKEYRVFLLSNTNPIHLNFIDNYVIDNFKLKSLEDLFEKAYYSHQMGLRKPNSKIFTTILNDKNLIPEETLFIDDSEQHILSAKQLNLKIHHLLETETIVDIFNAH